MVEKSNVPEIRFAGFADPWEQRKLGNELLFLRNNTLSRADLNGVQGDALDVHYGDVLVKYGAVLNVAKTTLPRITKSGQPGKTLGDPLNDGDIIMSDTAEDETAGKCSELCEIRDRTVYSGLHTIPCRPRRKYASGFLGHYLNAPVFHNQLIPLMQGIKVISLSKTSLSEANLVVPSIREQEKISATFSRLDTLITLHQRKYDKLGELKKSLLEKMFPKEGEVFPEIRFAGFADPWEQRKLRELVDVRSGRDYQHLEEGPIPVYGTGGYMTGVNEALSYDEDAIGIGRKGTIDKPYRLFAPFWTVDTLFYAVPRENVNLDFALCLFRNVDWKSKDESTGLPSLSKTIINESDVYVPRNPEQRQIGQLFSRLDALITLHQRKLELLRNIKKALLDKMFVEGE